MLEIEQKFAWRGSALIAWRKSSIVIVLGSMRLAAKRARTLDESARGGGVGEST
jgi:hypothetical protein